MGFRHVVAVEEDRVATVDVLVRAGLAIRAKGLLEGRSRSGGAEPGVAVHVRGAHAGLPDHSQRVVLLKEEAGRWYKSRG